jgi:AraC-like DNA-binding protein/predicted transcriptional regulator YdeE
MDMNQDKKVELVQEIQNYIKENIGEENFSLDYMCKHLGYSMRHINRLFSELLEMTPVEYVRKVTLTMSVEKLLKTENNIIDIALDTNYESHEGYTRAFKKQFNVRPEEYRKSPIAIPLFKQHPVSSYHTYLNHKERLEMDKNTMICMVTPIEKPKRKLIVLRAITAQDYWSFCEEKGCDWEGTLNSIPEKLDLAAIIELPKSMIKEGTASIVAGVEVPLDYDAKIPEEYEIIEVSAGTMLCFKSESFNKDEDFGVAISCVFRAFDKYKPNEFGYEYDFENFPRFNYGATPNMGAKLAFPVRKV